MKKSLIALCSALMVLAGCTDKNAFDITLTLPEEFRGQEVVLHSLTADDTLATALMNDTVVVLKGKVEQPTLAAISVGGIPVNILVAEPGSIVVNEDGITGTVSNDQYNDFQNEAMAEESDGLQLANDFVLANPTNPYSYALISEMGFMFTPEAIDAYLAANPDKADDSMLKGVQQIVKVRDATSTGQNYIDFSGKLPNGKEVKLSSYITKAKYTIVDFWAPWCGPCCREIPGLQKLYEQYKDQGLEVVGAEVWRREGHDPEAKAKELGVTYPIMYDVASTVTEEYGIYGIPCIMVIDKEGKIVSRDVTGQALAAFIASLFPAE